MRTLLVTLLAALAAPALAHAAGPSLVVRDVPVNGARSLAAAAPSPRFDLLGLHWRGRGEVSFRTRSLVGRWSPWRTAEAENRPDRGSAENRRTRGWQLGSPVWTGASNRLEVRTAGGVARVRAYYVRSPLERIPLRRVAVAGAPAIVSRAGWGAEEEIVRARPRYAAGVRFAIVHHTATSNGYTAAQAPAIVRGIEVYHVSGNGWNDLGYSFLVDRFGRVYEGRRGGIGRAVIGAHAEGFNTGSTGVALLGNFTRATMPPAMRSALVSLLAWRLDVAHVDPLSSLSATSGGNAKYRAGRVVTLHAISGHRDTGPSDCPGDAAYAALPGVAADVARTGLPKLYAPAAAGALGGPVAFTARLSAPSGWAVTVADATGTTVARGRGAGLRVAWTWSSAGAGRGPFGWTIEAGAARPATGTLGRGALPPSPAPVVVPPPAPPPELLAVLTVQPAAVSPNGDGAADAAQISYTLGAAAFVTVSVLDANGLVVATPVADQRQSARPQAFPFAPDDLADGSYTVTVAALGEDGRQQSAQAPLVVGRTLADYALSPATVVPDAGGASAVAFTFSLAKPALVTIELLRADGSGAVAYTGDLPVGQQRVDWTATLAEGLYTARITVQDDVVTVSQELALTVSRAAQPPV